MQAGQTCLTQSNSLIHFQGFSLSETGEFSVLFREQNLGYFCGKNSAFTYLTVTQDSSRVSSQCKQIRLSLSEANSRFIFKVTFYQEKGSFQFWYEHKIKATFLVKIELLHLWLSRKIPRACHPHASRSDFPYRKQLTDLISRFFFIRNRRVFSFV